MLSNAHMIERIVPRRWTEFRNEYGDAGREMVIG